MARDVNGTYARVSNSFTAPVAGTTISPTDADAFWDELDTEITDSLSRSGKGGMSADLDMNNNDINEVKTAVFQGSTSGNTTVLATAVAGTTTLTLPAATDTIVGKATTDTLTNKSMDAANNTFTGLVSYVAAQSLTSAQQKQSRANIGTDDRNYIINASGNFYQRGLGSKTDGTYSFDRWLILTQTAAISTSQVADAEDGTPYMMRLTQSQAAAQRMGTIQWIEKEFCRELRGQSVVLSARVRMSASTTLRYAIVEWTGTADTITKDVVLDWTNATFTAGQFFTTTTTTIVGTGSIALTANTLTAITVLTGAVSSSMNNLSVFFWTDSTQAQNVTLDIAKVKLERGAVATPFIPTSYHQELIDCSRYYTKSFALTTTPAQNVGLNLGDLIFTATAAGAVTQRAGKTILTPRMRIAPTITLFNPSAANAEIRDQTAAADCTASGSSSITDSGFRIHSTGAAGTAVGNLLGAHFTAEAEL